MFTAYRIVVQCVCLLFVMGTAYILCDPHTTPKAALARSLFVGLGYLLVVATVELIKRDAGKHATP